MIEEMTIIKNYHHFFLNNQSTVFRLFQQTLLKSHTNFTITLRRTLQI